MGKGKLQKFADMREYPNVVEHHFSIADATPFPMKGSWGKEFFGNDNPIVIELGCGRGEYTVGLARRYPDKNFIGVDIKGARMWTGATEAIREGLKNVGFLRTNIEIIDHFFAPGEVSEIWLTFPDPQMKKHTLASCHPASIPFYSKRLSPLGFLFHLFFRFVPDSAIPLPDIPNFWFLLAIFPDVVALRSHKVHVCVPRFLYLSLHVVVMV